MPDPADIAGSTLYLATALLCLWTGRRKGSMGWRLPVAVFLALWAAARLLDAEGQLRETLKAAWVGGHAYADRGDIQTIAVMGLAVLLTIAVALLAFIGSRRAVPLAIPLGLGGLVVLAMLRVVSWHQSDRLLYAGLGFVRIHHALELACISAVVLAALAQPPRRRSRRRSR